MAQKDSPTATFTAKRSSTEAGSLKGMNPQIMDLALDARDYYGENDLAADVLRSKYLAPSEQGPMHMWSRIAKALASVEQTEADKEYWYNQFLNLLFDFKFVPGGRVMHGAGREESKRR